MGVNTKITAYAVHLSHFKFENQNLLYDRTVSSYRTIRIFPLNICLVALQARFLTISLLCCIECKVDLPRLDPENKGLGSLSSSSSNIPKAIYRIRTTLVIVAYHYHNYSKRQPTIPKLLYNDRPLSWILNIYFTPRN